MLKLILAVIIPFGIFLLLIAVLLFIYRLWQCLFEAVKSSLNETLLASEVDEEP